MKKFLACLIVACAAFAIPARAEVDDVTFSLSSITTNEDSATYMVRGSVEGVIIAIPTAKTATVSIATASGVTLFSKSMTSATDGYIPLRHQVYGSTGSALTYQSASSDAANTYTNAVLGVVSIAEKVTATVAPAASTTGTNAYTVKLIIRK